MEKTRTPNNTNKIEEKTKSICRLYLSPRSIPQATPTDDISARAAPKKTERLKTT